MLTDSHCHLFMEPLGSDPEGVLRRARRAGVGRVVVPAYDTCSWDPVASLSSRPGVYSALGLHPWAAAEGLDVVTLKERLQSSGAVAVGEIGLDFKVESPSPEVQLDVFRSQLDLALEMDLPVILHCRGAFEEMLSVFSAEPFAGRLRGVVHAFTRGPFLAGRFLDLGFHLAFGGAVTRPRAGRTRRSAAIVPLERMLIETDSPSIGMEGLPPSRVEPADAVRVATALAEIRGDDFEAIARSTSANAERLFGLDAEG